MADLRNVIIDIMDGREAVPCSDECKYFAFPRLDRACVLSDVYSVRKGEMCFTFEKAQEVECARTNGS